MSVSTVSEISLNNIDQRDEKNSNAIQDVKVSQAASSAIKQSSTATSLSNTSTVCISGQNLTAQFSSGILQQQVTAKIINPHTLIHKAILENSPEVIRFLLAQGVSVDYLDEHGMSPLTMALLNRCNYAVDVLLENGANPNSSSKWNNMSPLELTIHMRDYRNTEQLVNYGANVDDIRRHLAELIGMNYPLAEVIIYKATKDECFFKSTSNDSRFFIMNEFYAVLRLIYQSYQGGNQRLEGEKRKNTGFKLLKLMIDNGFDLNPERRDHYIPIISAIEQVNHTELRREVVTFLINSGVDVNKTQYYRDTLGTIRSEISPLIMAICTRDLELVKIMVESGADINQKTGDNINNTTPLRKAVHMGSSEIIQYLLQKGAR